MKTRLVFILLMSFLLNGIQAQNEDIKLLRQINLHRNKSLDPAFKFITDTGVPISAGIPVALFGIGWIEKNKTLKQDGLYMGASLLGAEVVTYSLKKIINRDRPYITYPDIQKESSGGSPSFPSGHASAAFSTATYLSLTYPKWYVIAPSFVWASAVAYSRMDLGVHYPSDVLAGMIVGIGSAYLCYKAKKWFNKKKKLTVIQ